MIPVERKRLEWIDALKGFAMICVVLGHAVDGYIRAQLFPEDVVLMKRLFDFLYCFHMPLFFAISGIACRIAYFTPASNGKGTELGRKQAFLNQIGNLVLLYFIYSLIIGLLKIALSDVVNRTLSWTDLLPRWIHIQALIRHISLTPA